MLPEDQKQEPKQGLNDLLALERTIMSNDRTLLSFIRTALYFAVAGISLHQLMPGAFSFSATLIFFGLAALLLVLGLYKYWTQLRKIARNRQQIGGYLRQRNT